jgi:type VI protein secretion system component VasF
MERIVRAITEAIDQVADKRKPAKIIDALRYVLAHYVKLTMGNKPTKLRKGEL